MYFLPKPRKRRSRDLRPEILHHILSVIGIDRIRDVAEKIVIIAVHRRKVYGNAVAVLDNDIPHTRIGKNIFHVRNQIPQVALPEGGVIQPFNQECIR